MTDPRNPNLPEGLTSERVVTAADPVTPAAGPITGERVVTAAQPAHTQSAATPLTNERVVHGTAPAASEHQIAAASYQAADVHDKATLYLYEERARVDVSVESQGQVVFRKKIVEKEEMIPVTIHREILEIVTAPASGSVHIEGITLNGQPLEAGRSYEVVLTEERAHVTKQVFPVQEVSVRKQQISEQHTEQVTLRREVLEVDGPTELIHEQTRP